MYAIASVSTHSFLSICPLLPHEVADPWVVMRLLDNECSPGCVIMDAHEAAGSWNDDGHDDNDDEDNGAEVHEDDRLQLQFQLRPYLCSPLGGWCWAKR